MSWWSTSRAGGARAGALLLVVLGACAAPPTQTYRSTYQAVRSGGVTTKSWSNLAEVGVQDHVGPDLEYRVTERLLHTQQSVGATDNDSVLHQPSLDLILTAGTLTWLQGYELQEDRTFLDGAPDNDLTRKEVLQRFDWNPVDLPQVRGWLDYRTLEDLQFLDQETVETLLEVTDTRGPFDYLVSLENEQLDDHGTNQEIDRRDLIGRGTYREQTSDGSLSTTLSLYGQERTVDTQAPGNVVAPTQVFPVAGLSVVDSTPQIATLAPNAALIDGDDTTSAGIDIGGFASGGQLDVNMGVELPVGATVDIIDVVTVSPVDPLQAPQFNFSVWVSTDNSFWTLVTAAAPFVYETAFRRFRLAIPQVGDRFVKVVNTATSPAAPSVLVSELRVSQTMVVGTTSSLALEDSVRSASWNLTWLATEDVRLSYDLFLQTFETQNGGNTTRDETRVDNTLAAFWTPRRDLDFNLLGELRRRTDVVQQDEDFTLVNARTIYRPLDTLDVTLTHTRTDREVDGADDLATWATQLGASAQLLEHLEAEVIAEVNEQDDVRNLREIDRTIVSASLLAGLTPELDMALGFRDEQASVTGVNAGQIPDPSEERYELTLIYQPGSRLSADAQLEWKDTFAGSGLDQRYRIDWIPFQDGALDVQLNYDRIDTGSSFGERIDSYQVLTRWSFDPNVFLEVNFASQVPELQARTEILTVSFNATL